MKTYTPGTTLGLVRFQATLTLGFKLRTKVATDSIKSIW